MGSIEETALPWRSGLFVLMYGRDYAAHRPVQTAAMVEHLPGKQLDTIHRVVFPCGTRSRPHRRQSMAERPKRTRMVRP